MRVTESTYPFRPEPTDEELRREIARALARRWALSIAHADAPACRSDAWEEWGGPVLDAPDAEAALDEVKACRAAFPGRCVRLVAFEASRGHAAACLELVVQRGGAGRPARARRARHGRRALVQPERSAS